MTLEELQVLITANTSGLTKELNTMKAQLNVANVEAKKATDGIKESFAVLGKAVAGVLTVGAIVNFTKTSLNAASQLEGAMLGLRSILEGQGRSFSRANDFIQSYINDGLVPLTDAVTAYKNLAARGYEDKQIEQVMLRLKDSASFGRQASYTLGEAVKSATEGLKNENSILVDNAGVTKNVSMMWADYAKQIGKGEKSLSLAEKRQAEVNGILQETQFQVGDAAKYSQTYAGRLAALNKTLQDVRVNVGQAFTPIANVALPLVQSLADSLAQTTNTISQFMQALFGANRAQEQSANAAAKAQAGVGDAVAAAGKKAKKALAGFDEINTLSKNSDAGTSVVDGSIPGSVGDMPMNFSTNAAEVGAKIKEMADKVRDALKPIGQYIKEMRDGFAEFSGSAIPSLKSIYDTITQKGAPGWRVYLAVLVDIADIFKNSLLEDLKLIDGSLKAIADLLNGDFSGAWKNLKSTVNGVNWKTLGDSAMLVVNPFSLVVQKISEHIGLTDKMKESWANLKTSVGATWDGLVTKAAETFGNIKLSIMSNWDALKTNTSTKWEELRVSLSAKWDAIRSIKWSAVKDDLLGHWNTLKTNTSTKWDDIKATMSAKWDLIKGIKWSNVKDAVLGVWGDIKKETDTIWSNIGLSIKNAINPIIDSINAFIRSVNNIKIDIPEINTPFGKVGGMTIGMPHIPDIPRLADGGITNGKMLAMIGDNPGGREVISPLGDLTNMIAGAVRSAVESAMKTQGSSGEQTIILKLGETELARTVVKTIKDYQRQTGQPLMTF
jgi:hypothetical protein